MTTLLHQVSNCNLPSTGDKLTLRQRRSEQLLLHRPCGNGYEWVSGWASSREHSSKSSTHPTHFSVQIQLAYSLAISSGPFRTKRAMSVQSVPSISLVREALTKNKKKTLFSRPDDSHDPHRNHPTPWQSRFSCRYRRRHWRVVRPRAMCSQWFWRWRHCWGSCLHRSLQWRFDCGRCRVGLCAVDIASRAIRVTITTIELADDQLVGLEYGTHIGCVLELWKAENGCVFWKDMSLVTWLWERKFFVSYSPLLRLGNCSASPSWDLIYT